MLDFIQLLLTATPLIAAIAFGWVLFDRAHYDADGWER